MIEQHNIHHLGSILEFAGNLNILLTGFVVSRRMIVSQDDARSISIDRFAKDEPDVNNGSRYAAFAYLNWRNNRIGTIEQQSPSFFVRKVGENRENISKASCEEVIFFRSATPDSFRRRPNSSAAINVTAFVSPIPRKSLTKSCTVNRAIYSDRCRLSATPAGSIPPPFRCCFRSGTIWPATRHPIKRKRPSSTFFREGDPLQPIL